LGYQTLVSVSSAHEQTPTRIGAAIARMLRRPGDTL
jgi:hypothetical protein